MELCINDNCDKRAISFSPHCGEHTDNEWYAEVLKELKPGKYDKVYISEMDISDLKLADIYFYDSTIEDCHFEGGDWKNIRLEYSSLKSCLFENVTKSNFTIDEESIWASCTYQDCTFIDLKAIVISLNNGEFRNSTFVNTTIDQSLLTQVDFSSTKFFKLNISVSGLETISFQTCHLVDLKVSDIKLAVTFCLDTIFEDGSFTGELTHDFYQVSEPFELCLFQNCYSEWEVAIKEFKTWNGVDEDPLSFYSRVLDHITQTVHINNLTPVQFLVERVTKIESDHSSLAKKLKDMFNIYFSHIRKEQDISGFGQLASLMGRLPQELILNKNQYLPSPKILESSNVLRIEIVNDINTLNALSKIVTSFERLDAVLTHHGYDPLKVEDFRKGTITFVVSTTAATLAAIVVVLYKAGHLFLDTENKILTNKKLKRDLRSSKQKEKIGQYDEQLKIQQITLNELEIEKRKNELRSNRLPDKYIQVTKEEVLELTPEDPFDRLQLKPYSEVKEAADELLEHGDTNVYIEVLEKAVDL